MRRFLAFFGLTLAVACAVVPSASALNRLSSEEKVLVTQDLQGDVLAASPIVLVQHALREDLSVFGGDVVVSEPVAQDFLFLAGNVRSQAPIGDDVRGIAGDVEFSRPIGGDALLFGLNVDVLSGASVSGSLLAGASSVSILAPVSGDVEIWAKTLTLGAPIHGHAVIHADTITVLSGAQIDGNLRYGTLEMMSKEYVKEGSVRHKELEAATRGTVTFENPVQSKQADIIQMMSHFFENSLALFVSHLLFVFVCAAIVFFLFRSFWVSLGGTILSEPTRSFLYGFLSFIATPFIILLLVLSILGLPIGLFLFFLYVFAFFLFEFVLVASLVGVVLSWKQEQIPSWMQGILLFLFSLLVSVLGLFGFFGLFFVLGALMIRSRARFTRSED